MIYSKTCESIGYRYKSYGARQRLTDFTESECKNFGRYPSSLYKWDSHNTGNNPKGCYVKDSDSRPQLYTTVHFNSGKHTTDCSARRPCLCKGGKGSCTKNE